MTKQYLDMLIESLQKKKQLLDDISGLCDKQSELVKQEELDADLFDQLFDQKGDMIAQLDLLDNGFDSVFDRVKQELATPEQKAVYANEIRMLQDLIRQVTDLSMRIQTSEERNKAAVESYFAKQRAGIKQGREGSSVAMNYYLNMKNRQIVPPHFYDTKN